MNARNGDAVVVITTAVLMAAIGGCSAPSSSSVPQSTTERLGKLLLVYANAATKLDRPPQSLADLEPFVKEAGFSSEIFVSPNDGQPYQITWGVDPRRPDGKSKHHVIAFERTGRGGNRFVLTSMGIVAMSDREFDDAKIASDR